MGEKLRGMERQFVDLLRLEAMWALLPLLVRWCGFLFYIF